MTVPNPRRVIVAIFFIHRAENVAEVPTFFVGIEMMVFNKFLNAFAPGKIVGVFEVNLLNGNLIGRNGISVVRDTLSDPVMAGDDFHVPDTVFVREQDRITCGRTVLFDQLAEVFNAMARGFDEWQHHVNDQIFIKTVFDKRIEAQRPFITVSTFGCGHRDIALVDTTFFVVAELIIFNIRNGIIAITIFRQVRLKPIKR